MKVTISPKIDYAQLEQLSTVISRHEQLAEREKQLSIPPLSNLDELQALYKHFEQIISELPRSHQPDQRAARKLFLFIALYLYSPSALAGRRLDKGLRDVLLKAMGLSSCRAVTYHCNGLGLWYNMYPDFKHVLDHVYSRLVSEAGLCPARVHTLRA